MYRQLCKASQNSLISAAFVHQIEAVYFDAQNIPKQTPKKKEQAHRGTEMERTAHATSLTLACDFVERFVELR